MNDVDVGGRAIDQGLGAGSRPAVKPQEEESRPAAKAARQESRPAVKRDADEGSPSDSSRSRPRGYIERYQPHPKTIALLEDVKAVLEEYREHWPLTALRVFVGLCTARFGAGRFKVERQATDGVA